jgi:4-hydroxybenzoyl-CoA thioesterase/acyl-CoA thioester hydrolase
MTIASEPFLVSRRVEFRDTDAAGIVHFSAFFPMMEAAEHEMLRALGLSVMQPLDNGVHLTWPRVASSCDFLGAARFEDLLTIEVNIEHLGTKSVRYGFYIRRDQTAVARGTITAVCCLLGSDGHLTSIPIPEAVRAILCPMHFDRSVSSGVVETDNRLESN